MCRWPRRQSIRAGGNRRSRGWPFKGVRGVRPFKKVLKGLGGLGPLKGLGGLGPLKGLGRLSGYSFRGFFRSL